MIDKLHELKESMESFLPYLDSEIRKARGSGERDALQRWKQSLAVYIERLSEIIDGYRHQTEKAPQKNLDTNLAEIH